MSEIKDGFVGKWLHHGDWHGRDFTHALPTYDHDESPGPDGATQMRHAVLETGTGLVGVWVPARWSDEQALEALESNW